MKYLKEWWNSYINNSSSCFFPSSLEEGIPATWQFSNGSFLEGPLDIAISETGSFWGYDVDVVVECVE